MNFKVTEDLLNAIQPVCDLSVVTVSTQNKDYKGRTYESDLVTINEPHHVGFEVFDNEIIVFYFTNHDHFDYDTSKTENNEKYAENVIFFLNKLFTLPILYVKVTKRKSIKKEEYFFVMQNGDEESISGPIGHLISKNPFAKQITTKTTWQYDKEAGDFITLIPKHIDPDAICYVTISDSVYFEIFERSGIFTFIIMKKEYDDYNGVFYWVAFDDGTKSMFDSKEKVIEAAKMQIKLYNIATSNCLCNMRISEMKKVIRDDYTFNIDIEKTNSFYLDIPKVFDGISEYLPELTLFLVSLGIDIEKPVKYDPNDTYDLLYTTFGTVSCKDGYELDFYGEDRFVSVVVISARENTITLEVFGIMLKKE